MIATLSRNALRNAMWESVGSAHSIKMAAAISYSSVIANPKAHLLVLVFANGMQSSFTAVKHAGYLADLCMTAELYMVAVPGQWRLGTDWVLIGRLCNLLTTVFLALLSRRQVMRTT